MRADWHCAVVNRLCSPRPKNEKAPGPWNRRTGFQGNGRLAFCPPQPHPPPNASVTPSETPRLESDPVELRSYSLSTLESGAAANTPGSWKLPRSVDGVAWSDVSSSSSTSDFTGGASQTKHTVLGASATHGGYAH